jgi:hypothetical protein
MIPKVIHFVWVGPAPKPELVEKCIRSWRFKLPDYQIMEWGNASLDSIDNQYVREAFAWKKWAFVSDYLRLHALQKYGGFYFDSDLEVTQDISEFRRHRFVTGFEKYEALISPVTAFMGAVAASEIITDLLSEYSTESFIRADGSFNERTNTDRISSYFMRKFGLSRPFKGDQVIWLSNEDVIYPYWYFCTPEEGKQNYSIHHFNGSWVDRFSRKVLLRTPKGNVSLVLDRGASERYPCKANEELLLGVPVSKRLKIVVYRTKRAPSA